MPGESETKLVQRLVDSFHAFLDEALIVAIANDYNLEDPSAYDAAHATLQDLARSVPSEEATGFDPSGIPVLPEWETDELRDEPTTSTSISHQASQAQGTDPSSTDTSSAAAEPHVTIPRLTSFDNDSKESKILLLQSMFSELKQYDVKYALQKANGDFQAALDDLLNIQYLQSTGQQMKGVDGFFKPDDAPSAKNKRKKKVKKALTPDSDPSRDGSPSLGGETTWQDEIEYIAERLGVRSDEVSGIYRKCECSKGATVVQLLEQYISHGIETKDDAGKRHADDLARKYRYVPDKYMPTIVHVAGSIPQFADDLTALLNKHFTKQSKGQKLDLGYRLTPLPGEDIEGGGVLAPGKTTVRDANVVPGRSTAATSSLDLAQAVQVANNYHQAKVDAESSAARLHRRGASSPLYRQAASYYADRAREQARYAQQATSTAADLLVEKQSAFNSLDLHGVLVHDGVRIARQKTQDWWQGLGEFRVRRAREESFTVITGLGRHNASGVSRLRQAVAAALLQDGWKVQVETGKFVVTGRR
ncbi:hypothetical protein TOPH_06773 [Tolypocladium ophioglossoides CBS 100239]|uniref:Smr domain-containing protein n=1 Tax=Tolypocladium ophioglossoides (strain CBS 100239) TaxID=1163406 RepID=A0A0L0N3G9_TOLOC|nr:hypothetical protein TOPH_06773 [Tolypocladium ophioglossoides CBS 100239]